jgi:hypothetical protein
MILIIHILLGFSLNYFQRRISMFKGGKALFVAASLACVSLSAMAEEAPYATYGVRLETTAVQIKEPVMTSPVSKKSVAFRIENNTGKAAYFVNGAENEYIPVISQNTVIAPYTKEAYKVVDAEGNVIASWKLTNNGAQNVNVSSASKAQFSQWGDQLQQVMESTRNRSVSYVGKSEPAVFYSRSTSAPSAPVKKHTVVRGYW